MKVCHCYILLFIFLFNTENKQNLYALSQKSEISEFSLVQIEKIVIAPEDQDFTLPSVDDLILNVSNETIMVKPHAEFLFSRISDKVHSIENWEPDISEVVMIGAGYQDVVSFLGVTKKYLNTSPIALHIFNPNPRDINYLYDKLTRQQPELSAEYPQLSSIKLYQTEAENMHRYYSPVKKEWGFSFVYARNVLVNEIMGVSTAERIIFDFWNFLNVNGTLYVTGNVDHDLANSLKGLGDKIHHDNSFIIRAKKSKPFSSRKAIPHQKSA